MHFLYSLFPTFWSSDVPILLFYPSAAPVCLQIAVRTRKFEQRRIGQKLSSSPKGAATSQTTIYSALQAQHRDAILRTRIKTQPASTRCRHAAEIDVPPNAKSAKTRDSENVKSDFPVLV